MKNIIYICICVLLISSCKDKVGAQTKESDNISYKSFGKEIIAGDAIKASSMATHYKSMQVGDSINSKMSAKVISVCQAKGCWMTLNLEDGNEVMVKFKDYGFFMPKDIAGKEVIINGKAFVNEVAVDELRHYAEDAGKTEEEIASITEPKRTFSFEADGVLLKQ
jgi:hypothetical protein